MNSFWALVGMVFFASGCVGSSVETTRLNAAPRPLVSRPPQSVEIYASSAPTRAHVDIALLRANQGNFETDTPAMVQSLAERAGELGCDALFISGASERPGGVPPDAFYLIDPGSHALIGTCIVYVPQPATAGLAPPASAPPAANAIVLVRPEETKPPPSAIVSNVPVGSAHR